MVSSLSFNQLLTLYSWFPLAALLMVMLLIARFYEKFSGSRMYFRGFFVLLVLFAAAAIRYTNLGDISGDVFGDLASGFAGILLSVLCLVVYWRMLRKPTNHSEPPS